MGFPKLVTYRSPLKQTNGITFFVTHATHFYRSSRCFFEGFHSPLATLLEEAYLNFEGDFVASFSADKHPEGSWTSANPQGYWRPNGAMGPMVGGLMLRRIFLLKVVVRCAICFVRMNWTKWKKESSNLKYRKKHHYIATISCSLFLRTDSKKNFIWCHMEHTLWISEVYGEFLWNIKYCNWKISRTLTMAIAQH